MIFFRSAVRPTDKEAELDGVRKGIVKSPRSREWKMRSFDSNKAINSSGPDRSASFIRFCFPTSRKAGGRSVGRHRKQVHYVTRREDAIVRFKQSYQFFRADRLVSFCSFLCQTGLLIRVENVKVQFQCLMLSSCCNPSLLSVALDCAPCLFLFSFFLREVALVSLISSPSSLC